MFLLAALSAVPLFAILAALAAGGIGLLLSFLKNAGSGWDTWRRPRLGLEILSETLHGLLVLLAAAGCLLPGALVISAVLGDDDFSWVGWGLVGGGLAFPPLLWAAEAVERAGPGALPRPARPARTPGGTRDELPVTGPPVFEDAVRRLLMELRQRASHRHREVLTYFPGAVYDPERLMRELGPGYLGRSDGVFAIDGSDYGCFRWVFLHEVGHTVSGHTRGDWSQEAADAYAH